VIVPRKVNVYHSCNHHGEEARRFDISHTITYYILVLNIRIRHHQQNACLTKPEGQLAKIRGDLVACPVFI
jgi:hypothetical protein